MQKNYVQIITKTKGGHLTKYDGQTPKPPNIQYAHSYEVLATQFYEHNIWKFCGILQRMNNIKKWYIDG